MNPKDATSEWSRRNSAFHQELSVVLEAFIGKPKGQAAVDAITNEVRALTVKHKLDCTTDDEIRDICRAIFSSGQDGICRKCLTPYSNARGGCDVCNDWA